MRSILLTALLGAAAAPALAGESQTCTRGTDVRRIDVLTPGVVGRACDLKVTRDNGAYVSTPFHANNSESFCAERALEIISGLRTSGFQCAPSAPALKEVSAPEAGAGTSAAETAAAQAETPAAPTQEAAAVAPEEPAPAAAEVGGLPAQPEQAAAESAAVDLAAAPEPAGPTVEAGDAGSVTAPIAVPLETPTITPQVAEAAPEQTDVAQSPMSARAPTGSPAVMRSVEPAAQAIAALEQPPIADEEMRTPAGAPKIANGSPVALAPTAVSTAPTVRSPRPAVGRLIGAAADAKPLDVAVEPAAATPAAAPTAPVRTAMHGSEPRARPAEDIIKGVLAAQVAAWNEGDLEGFMGGYWKDPDLRFVSGSAVLKGWKETFARYRDRYGAGTAMGRLSFEGLDVDLVSDDVATVIGRFRLVRSDGGESGAFTLVMKRFDGLWRIVHDHTVEDNPNTN
jgi:uncharacterized protein (TIGR02246 family)